MRTHRFARIATVAAVAAGLTAGAVSSSATPAQTAAAKKITRKGVDGVKLGATYKHLRAKHKVGKIHQGCEFAGPKARAAKLRKPLHGQVNFTRHKPRRVHDITVTGGAKARGVGIGDTTSDIMAKYPKATADHSTDSTFGATIVKVPKGGGGRLEFAVSTDTHKITLIGVPRIAICD
jgi:hypothetical protein